jgi:hypothetical protein
MIVHPPDNFTRTDPEAYCFTRADPDTHTHWSGDTNYPLIAFLIQATRLASLMMRMQCQVCTSACLSAEQHVPFEHSADCNSFHRTEA